ncbi:YceI family protein [Rhodococcus sp. AW25M09]|uniref:YceI family protein n=1 Tax=Rhodococcus sp. AW25M09 TaxID=1268303 RepID=UPI0003471E76|nr:YceI family protein [Rhodococcus sp. AW25M09]
MTTDTWTLDASDGGRLAIETGVTGKAAKMGHRLTIVIESWTASVQRSSGTPVGVELTADLESLNVVSGEGGATPWLGPEAIVAKANALKALEAKRHPRVHFVSTDVTENERGFLITGELEIHGVTKQIAVEVIGGGETQSLTSRTTVRQSDYGITPYSQMFGAMKVVDEVTVLFDVEYQAQP